MNDVGKQLQKEETVLTQPLVVAVVLCTNEAEDAAKCVASLLDVQYTALQVIVVDNASTDGSSELLRKNFPSIQIIRRESNQGYSAGNNTGIRAAMECGADYVLISNSDVVVDKNFLMPMVEAAGRSSTIGVVACTVRYQSHPDEIYYAAGQLSRVFCCGMNTTRRALYLMENELESDVSFVNGALLLFKQNVFEELGLMEEKFFLYFDDLEFSIRYGKKYRLVYTPKSVVYHKSGAGKGWRTYTETYLYYQARNRFWAFASESFVYRCYVLVFSGVNSIAKSIVISLNVTTDPFRMSRQLKALWRGFFDGLFMKEPA